MSRSEWLGNVVVITGASRGIGREMALQLAGQGARLALSARDDAALEELAEQCRSRGGQAVAVAADVTDEAQCASLIARTVERYGQVKLVSPSLIDRIARKTIAEGR